MSGLLFLSSEDFSIGKGIKGPILCNNIPSLSLILFYSTNCKYCFELMPIFKKLPGMIMGCQFGIINVSTNKEVINMSNQTIVPIEYIPYILLYVNGRPYIMYKGPSDIAEIGKFIKEVAHSIQSNSNNSFMKDERVKHSDKGIPKYSIGHPLCGDDKVCYLTEKEAYPAENKK